MNNTHESSRTELGAEPPGTTVETPPSGGSESEVPSSSPTETPPLATETFVLRPPAQKLKGWRLIVVEVCICLGLFFSTVDASIVSTALVTIGEYFEDFVKTIWIAMSYLLSYMAFSILWARLSDLLGRKWIVITAWTIFTVFSLACGLAQSLNQLIGFRTLQGLGGCGLYSMTNVVIPEITPKQHFPTMTGAQGAVFAVSSVLGPVLGGVISAKTTWRWIFYLNVPFGALIATILVFAWDEEKRKISDLVPYLVYFDYQGVFLLAAASSLLIVGLQTGGSAVLPWNSSLVISSLALSGSCLIALVAWTIYREKTWKKSYIPPLFPWRLLKNRVLSAAIAITGLTGYQLFLAIVAIPERYQIVNVNSALTAGIRLMPLLFASATGSTLNGLVSSKNNYVPYSLMGASCILLLGSGLMSTVPFSENVDKAMYGYQVIFGLGIGGTLSSTVIISSLYSDYEDYALAQGIVNQARILGGTIGLACSTIILNIKFGTNLSGILTPAQITRLRQTLEEITLLTIDQQVAVQRAFSDAFADQFRVCTYVAAAVLIFSLMTFSRRPVDMQKRIELGEAVIQGRLAVDEANRMLREKV